MDTKVPQAYKVGTNWQRKAKVKRSNMAEVSRFIVLVGVAVSLAACSEQPVPLVRSQGFYPTSSATVREVQIALRSRGYYAGIVDGFLGEATATGIRRLQIDRGERAKPVIDRQLLVSLGITKDYPPHLKPSREE
jgi:Putative peptidoglycan binding domain